MSLLRPAKWNSLKERALNFLFSSKQSKHSLTCLNLAQFFGVINDNVFKFVMAFLLIDTLGTGRASEILSITGAVYVIPFLLFSSMGGIFADRFSKQRLLISLKVLEIVIMTLALIAFRSASIWGCYTLLFLLSTHSAMFGPPKYGIIPELVPSSKVSRANGLITSFTYLAMIVGTFLASFLTEMTDHRFIIIAGFCLCVAIAGFFSALGIKHTPAQSPNKAINFLFIREIYRTLLSCRHQKHLLLAIFGSAYFLFLGAFTQLNIIPFAIESLHMSEVSGGYLFLSTALGIALGSLIAGRVSRKQIELSMPCLAGIGISILLLVLPSVSHHLISVISCLVGIGILGGLFIVPFDTFIQLFSENAKRGQTIAAANFFSFLGVFIASVALFLFTQILGLSSATGFGIIGGITLFVALILTCRLSDYALSLFSRKCLYPLAHFQLAESQPKQLPQKTLFILEKATWKKSLLLIGAVPQVRLLLPTSFPSAFLRCIYSLLPISKSDATSNRWQEIAKEELEKGVIPCLFLKEAYCFDKTAKTIHPLIQFFKRSSTQCILVSVDDTSSEKKKRLRYTPLTSSSP